MPLWLLAAGAAVLLAGGGIKLAGEGVEDTSNSLIKIGLVAGGGYLIAKKMKVI